MISENDIDDVSISGEGMDRLVDVQNSLKDLVWAIAESIAAERSTPAKIEIEDIDSAATKIVDSLRREVSNGHLPTGIAAAIDEIDRIDALRGHERARHATAS